MSPTIRIDDDVFEALQNRAKPFVDTPNDVLRRVLGVNGARPAQLVSTDTPVDRAPVVIDEPVMLIRINQSFRPGMSSEELYQVTRNAWRVGPRREGARFAFAVFQGIVQEVYEIQEWRKATPNNGDTWVFGERWEFVGARADDTVRSKYLGRRVSSYFTRGSQGPITYVNC